MKLYNSKNIFIFGGSSGIGLASARMFSSLGANVIIFARNHEKLESALIDIELKKRAEDQRFTCMELDVSDFKDIDKKMAKAVDKFGKPDIVINCAGVVHPNYFEDISFERFDNEIKTNLYGTRNVIASLLPFMKERGGNIVNVSSVAGFLGVFGYTSYCASKFAVIGFSESLRSELKRYGIIVSVLCPPDTDTPMLKEEAKTRPAETEALASDAGLLSPDYVALSLIKGMRKGRFIILPGMESRFIYSIKRLFPRLVEYIIDRKILKVQKKNELK